MQADLLLQVGSEAEFRETLVHLRDGKYPSPLLQFLDAKWYVRLEHWAVARDALEPLRPALADWPALARQADLLLANCYEHLADPERQLAAYRRALTEPSAGPRSSEAMLHYALGGTLLALGKVEEAIGALRLMASWADAPRPGRALLARLLLARELRRSTAHRDFAEVELAIADLAKHASDSVDVPLLRAELEMARERPSAARRVLEAALGEQPRQVELWIALADLDLRRGQIDTARRLLAEAQDDCGDSVALRLARARWWSVQPRAEGRAGLAELERGVDRWPNADQARLERGLADLYFRRGDLADARRLWSRAAQREPNDVRLRLVLFDLALQVDDTDDVQQQLKRIEAIDGTHGSWTRQARVARALARAARGDRSELPGAGRLLEELAKDRPNWPRVPLLQGDLAQVEGRSSEALEHYLRAVELGERDPRLIRQTVQRLSEARRFVEADQVLRKLEQERTLANEGLKRLAAEAAAGARDFDRALQLAREAVASDSTDWRDRVWLGQLLTAIGRWDEAESQLRQAARLAEKSPEPWVLLVQLLVRRQRPGRVEDVLSEAAKILDPLDATLLRAAAGELLERFDDAEKAYADVLRDAPQDPRVLRAAAGFQMRRGRLDAATPLLRRLADSNANDADTAWARRGLALCLPKRTFPQFQNALALLEQNTPAGGAARAEDLVVRATILATRREARFRNEAVQILEQLATRGVLNLGQQLLLAQLYEAVGRRARGDALLDRLLAANDRDPTLLAYYVEQLLERNQRDRATPWLRKLVQIEPDSLRTATLQARDILLAGGFARDAIARLETAVRTLDRRDPAERAVADRAAFLAQQIEELARFARRLPDSVEADHVLDEAERAYRARLGTHPESRVTLALFLARRGKANAALDELLAPTVKLPPDTLAPALLAVLRATPASAEQITRVERWLLASQQKHPASAILWIERASLRDLQGRYDEAIADYRQAVARAPDNPMPLNNLAWLLAMQRRDLDEALALVNRAIDAAGPLPLLLDTRAAVYLALGKLEPALADLREAVASEPSLGFLLHLALAERKANHHAAVRKLLERAATLDARFDSLHPLAREMLSPIREAFER
jgi:tetratricopeptide (TPR) repeat protein